jgi:hypothetical protein
MAGNFWVAKRLQGGVVNLTSGWPTPDQEELVRLQKRLQQIKIRLIDMEARVDALRTTAMTLREFTEK